MPGCATSSRLSNARAASRTRPLPVSYAYNWTGPYIGGYAGKAVGPRTWSYLLGGFVPDQPHYAGYLAGGQAGYNVQIRPHRRWCGSRLRLAPTPTAACRAQRLLLHLRRRAGLARVGHRPGRRHVGEGALLRQGRLRGWRCDGRDASPIWCLDPAVATPTNGTTSWSPVGPPVPAWSSHSRIGGPRRPNTCTSISARTATPSITVCWWTRKPGAIQCASVSTYSCTRRGGRSRSSSRSRYDLSRRLEPRASCPGRSAVGVPGVFAPRGRVARVARLPRKRVCQPDDGLSHAPRRLILPVAGRVAFALLFKCCGVLRCVPCCVGPMTRAWQSKARGAGARAHFWVARRWRQGFWAHPEPGRSARMILPLP